MSNAEAFIRHYLQDYSDYKSYWNYEDGCVLKGCADLYAVTREPAYRDFVLRYLERRVAPDGSIPTYETAQYNIDSINCGKALFFALDQTGDERYRKAIEYVMQRLREHPRCQCGSSWHKTIYPNQIWLDGLYMAEPFYMEYEVRFGDDKRVSDILAQFANVRRLLYNQEKGLYYHACDEARMQPWCNPVTGCSPNFWLRSIGWYLMALADGLALLPDRQSEAYRSLASLLDEAIRGILPYRRPDGMFSQVVDHPEAIGNYAETSGTAMIAYALMKGCTVGALPAEPYASVGRSVMESLLRDKLVGDAHLVDICAVAGLGPGNKRDGSVAYYLSEPIVSDDAKGVGPFMMAYSQYIRKNALGG